MILFRIDWKYKMALNVDGYLFMQSILSSFPMVIRFYRWKLHSTLIDWNSVQQKWSKIEPDSFEYIHLRIIIVQIKTSFLFLKSLVSCGYQILTDQPESLLRNERGITVAGGLIYNKMKHYSLLIHLISIFST